MISRLRGILLEKTPPWLLIDVNGLAYEVEAPMFSFYRLPDIGEQVVLHTHLVVREDAQLLYGFFCLHERALFRSLIKVNGVGPKLALAILSGIEPDAFVTCVMHSDTASLVRIPGVGKKTAERLVVEMRDRLNDWSPERMMSAGEHKTVADTSTEEAISALVSLGYKPLEARQAVTQAAKEHQDLNTSEELIRHALRSRLNRSIA
jgi:Holliday junction DNA helicase RuvA